MSDDEPTTSVNEKNEQEEKTEAKPSFLQVYERSMYEMRIVHPILFNLTTLNLFFGSLLTAARLKRRGHVFRAMASVLTLSASSMTCFAFARTYSTKFQSELALPVREQYVGEEIARIENAKLQKWRQVNHLKDKLPK